MLKVNSSLLRVLDSAEYGRLRTLVGSEHIPDLILHIVACRVLTDKDIFTYCLYFNVNSIDIVVAIDFLKLNPFYNLNIERKFYDTWEYCDSFWFQPNWFTYIIAYGGVYYSDGRKKVSNPSNFKFGECDADLLFEFNQEFEWSDFRLIWDPVFGGHRLWRYDRELPEGAYFVANGRND